MKLSSLVKKFHGGNCSLLCPSILCYVRTLHSFPLEEMVTRYYLGSREFCLPDNGNYLDLNILVSRTVRNKLLFSRECLVSDILLQQWESIKTNRCYTMKLSKQQKSKMKSSGRLENIIFCCQWHTDAPLWLRTQELGKIFHYILSSYSSQSEQFYFYQYNICHFPNLIDQTESLNSIWPYICFPPPVHLEGENNRVPEEFSVASPEMWSEMQESLPQILLLCGSFVIFSWVKY